jgi:hypothetical protein
VLTEGPLAPQPPAEPSPDRYAAVPAEDAEPPGGEAAGQQDPDAILKRALGGQDEILIARMDAHRRRSLWGRIGDGIRHRRHRLASHGARWHQRS